MRLTLIIYIIILTVAAMTGCTGIAERPLTSTAMRETQSSVEPTSDRLIDNTPTSAVAVGTQTIRPEPSLTEIPIFKLPEGDNPGWLLASPPEASESIRTAFTADGTTLAVSAAKPRIDFYGMESGEIVNTLSYKPSDPVGIMDLALTPDGSELIVASRGRIDVWDVAKKAFRTLTRDSKYYQFGTYQNVELSRDGVFLAVGPVFLSDEFSTTAGRTWRVTYAEVWETKTWERKWVLRDALPVFSFSPDGKSLATLSGGGLETLGEPTPVITWNMMTGLRHEIAVDGILTNLAYGPDGVVLAINTTKLNPDQSAGVSGTLLLDTTTEQVQRTITNSNNPLDLDFSPRGKLLAVLYDDDQIVLWNIETGEQSLVLSDLGKLRQPTFNPDGTLFTAVPWDGRILFWNVPNH